MHVMISLLGLLTALLALSTAWLQNAAEHKKQRQIQKRGEKTRKSGMADHHKRRSQ